MPLEIAEKLDNIAQPGHALRKLLDFFHDSEQLAITILDQDKQIVYFNTGSEKLTGFDAADVMEKPLDIFARTENDFEYSFKILDEQGFYFEPNARFVQKGGNHLTCLSAIFKLEYGKDEPAGYVAIGYDITELITGGQEIRESRDFFERLLNTLGDVVLAVNAEGQIIFCNNAVKNLFGFDRSEIVGKNWNEVFTEVLIDGNPIKDLAEDIKSAEQVEGKATFNASDSSLLQCQLVAHSISDDNDKVIGWVASITDITEQEALLETERITNHFMAASSDLGRYISEGLPLHTLLERVVGSVHLHLDLKASYFYLVDPDKKSASLQVHRNLHNAFLQAVKNINLELNFVQMLMDRRGATLLTDLLDSRLKLSTLIHKFGYEHTISLPLFHKDTLVGFLNLVPKSPFNDFELSLVESLGSQISLSVGNAMLIRDHREAERKYSLMVERANDGIMITQDGKFKYVNKHLADMLGYTISDLINIPITVTIDPSDAEEILSHYQSRISGKVPQEIYDGRLLTKDGDHLLVEFNACTIQYEGRSASLSFVRDISQRIELQNQVVEQKEIAEFFNDVLTHDINNFCHTLLGHLDNLSAELPIDLDKAHFEKLSLCKGNIGKISHIIDQVREMMHIQTIDKKGLLPQNVNDTISEAIETARETFPTEDVRFITELPKGTFFLGNNLAVLIFINIFTNAIKHNDKSDKVIKIDMASTKLEGRQAWLIRVSDNGPGIPESDRLDIFNRYKRMSERKGIGLGLSIVNSIVSKLNGKVYIDDKYEGDLGGTTMALILPKA